MTTCKCHKCGRTAEMPETHVLPIGWERGGEGDDFCRECMAPIRAALNKLNVGVIWICTFCGEYNEPSEENCKCCCAG